jgi:hypothetical protein
MTNMSLKEKIDELSPTNLHQFLKRERCNPNEFINDEGISIPLIYYLMKKNCSTRTLTCLIERGASINTPVIDWQKWLTGINLNYLPILLENGLKLNLDTKMNRILIELLIKGDVPRVVTLYKHGLTDRESIIKAIQTPELIISALNYLYSRVGHLCRQYKLNMDSGLLDRVCQLEKQYINLFRLIKTNNVELKDITNIGQVTQMVFNSYLYHLIEYFTELVDHSTLVNVGFYHYSNFPIINKIVMAPIYNDENFNRIEVLLREKMFIKKIVKKKLGKKIFRCSGPSANYGYEIGNQYQVKVVELEDIDKIGEPEFINT